MEITRRTDYAIRMLMELAHGGDGPVSVRSLASRQRVPYAFARGIQRDLAKAGLVGSRRGVKGGAMLLRPAEQITLLDVVRATQGTTSCSVCTSDPTWCDRMAGCAVHAVWRGADEMMAEYLGRKSLAGLIGEERGR
jgi:Rrf2 family protein